MLAMSAATAWAASITIQVGNTPLAGEENILFNQVGLADNALTVEGILSSGTIATFTSTTTSARPVAGRRALRAWAMSTTAI